MAASLVPGAVYTKLLRFRTLMRRHVMRELGRYDVIVTPAQAGGAPPIPTETGLTSKEAVIGQFFGIRSHRSPFNLSGAPAMAVPCGFTEGGLPLSIQIAGRPFQENTLFRIGPRVPAAHILARGTSAAGVGGVSTTEKSSVHGRKPQTLRGDLGQA